MLPKESLFKKQTLLGFVLGLSDPFEITGGKEKGGDWHHDDFSWAGVGRGE